MYIIDCNVLIITLRRSQTGEITDVSDWVRLGLSTDVDLTKHRIVKERRNIIK